MPERVAGVSKAAVEDATGYGWDDWLAELDDRDAREMTHEGIVAQLEDLGVDSSWYRQTIANGYELERGLWEKGETTDAGFQVGVQRTLRIGREALWELLLSAEGRAIRLGAVDGFDAEPGTAYETDDGTVGEVRTVGRASGSR